MDLLIRRMGDDELEPVVRVWERSRRSALAWLEERMDHSHEDNLRYFRDTVMMENAVWVAECGGALVGLLAVAGGEIDQLYVDPDAQQRGVGAALLAKAREGSPERLALYTFRRNEGARRFYERQGFRAVAFGVSPAPESEPDVRYLWEAAPSLVDNSSRGPGK